jgi:alkylation response protein AidB-like acyl-CoA dehydrogenase
VQFRFTDEQEALASLAQRVASDLSTLAPGNDVSDLAILVETGLSGLTISELDGGAGATLVEAAIVAEQFGQALVPSTVTGSFLIGPAALDLVYEKSVREDIAVGIVAGRPCSVVVGEDLMWPPKGPGIAWGWRPDAVVLSPLDDGLSLLEDPLVGHATEDSTLCVAPTKLVGPPSALGDSAEAQHFLAVTNVVTACLLLGHMRATLELAVNYAREREQFGVKIGSFQAVKHLCAEMLVDTESSHSIAYGAAALVAQSSDPVAAARSAACAKAWCGEAAIRVCEGAIQVHGGIGFTWESPLHLYLRAAHAVRASFMSPAAALDEITRFDQWI